MSLLNNISEMFYKYIVKNYNQIDIFIYSK